MGSLVSEHEGGGEDCQFKHSWKIFNTDWLTSINALNPLFFCQIKDQHEASVLDEEGGIWWTHSRSVREALISLSLEWPQRILEEAGQTPHCDEVCFLLPAVDELANKRLCMRNTHMWVFVHIRCVRVTLFRRSLKASLMMEWFAAPLEILWRLIYDLKSGLAAVFAHVNNDNKP